MSLHTTSLGDHGSRVVFLHGLFGQGRNWTQIGKELAEHHRVTLVDLPHHGRSSWAERWSWGDVVEQVASTIEEGGDPVALVGHSLGGKVAMLVALLHPDLVERLAVVDMSPVTYEKLTGGLAVYAEALADMDLATLEGREDAYRRLTAATDSPTIRAFLLQNLRREPGRDGAPDGWRWQANVDVLRRDLPLLGQWPEELLADVPPFRGPVVWIAGEHSAYIADEYADDMARWFPRVRRVTVKDAGHWVHSEQPETFSAVLRQFVPAD